MGADVKILVVEDEQEFADEILAELAAHMPAPVPDTATNREAAFARLDAEIYDFLILDLRIPTTESALDADPVHGLAVFTHARRVAPGTPILILTATSGDEYFPELLGQARQIDVWGRGEVPTVQFLKKINFANLGTLIGPLIAAVDALGQVEIDSPQYVFPVTYARLIRIFATTVGGARCIVSPLGGGLSGAQVLRIKVTDASGATIHNAVGKLGPLQEIQDEAQRYDAHISRLRAAATPRKLMLLRWGAKADAAIFYQLASDFVGTAFDAAGWRNEATTRVAASLEQMTDAWSEGVVESPHLVREVRQRVLGDDDLQAIVDRHGLVWVDHFERGRAQCIWCCVHGDLHGENALILEDGQSVLIDYGDVDEGPRSLDPISLEFSLLFHPKSPYVNGPWPSAAQAEAWFDLESYLVDCPVPEFVRSVREWGLRAAAGQREFAATAYAYLIRQLKYSTTDGIRALQLLEGARALYART